VILKLRHNGLSKDAVMADLAAGFRRCGRIEARGCRYHRCGLRQVAGLGHDDTDTGEGEVARLTQRLIGTLEPVVGATRSAPGVNIDYDQNSTEESDEKYDPSVSALLSVQRSEDDSGGGAVQSGVPGTASNIPQIKRQSLPTHWPGSRPRSLKARSMG